MVKGIYGANLQEDRSSMFCSQLVIAAYQQMGLLDGQLTATNFMPAHFESELDDHLVAARLGRLVMIPPDPDAENPGPVPDSVSIDAPTDVSIVGTETRVDEHNHHFTVGFFVSFINF